MNEMIGGTIIHEKSLRQRRIVLLRCLILIALHIKRRGNTLKNTYESKVDPIQRMYLCNIICLLS